MKRNMMITLSILTVSATACHSTQRYQEARKPFNTWAVGSIRDSAINQAIVTQGTLFPYHFDPHAGTLNELGLHDLGVLAEYHKEHPGNLNLPRGLTSDDLYERRVAAVATILSKSGVSKDRITIVNALPGGEGMPSERVVVILENQLTEPNSTALDSTRRAMATGGSR
jgi:hypothetical protein